MMEPTPDTDAGLLIVVPARGGSKRVPRKNVRPLNGKPLLDYTAAAIEGSRLFAPVVLTTDDPEIAARGRHLNWTIIDRPDHLSGDDVPSAPVVQHALQVWHDQGNQAPERIMLLQPTSPFRAPDTLRQSLTLLSDRPDADAVIGITQLHVGSRHVMTCGKDGFVSPVTDTNERAYIPNGAVFVIRAAAFRSHGSFYPPKTLGLEMSVMSSLDIDTEDDWRLAEAMMSTHSQTAEPPA